MRHGMLIYGIIFCILMSLNMAIQDGYVGNATLRPMDRETCVLPRVSLNEAQTERIVQASSASGDWLNKLIVPCAEQTPTLNQGIQM